MKKKKDEVIARLDEKTIIVNGKKYVESGFRMEKIGKVRHIKHVIFRPKEDVGYDKLMTEIKLLLSSQLDHVELAERVLEEILKKHTIDELKKIRRLLRKNAKVTRHDGCLGIDIDDGKEHAFIDIFD